MNKPIGSEVDEYEDDYEDDDYEDERPRRRRKAGRRERPSGRSRLGDRVARAQPRLRSRRPRHYRPKEDGASSVLVGAFVVMGLGVGINTLLFVVHPAFGLLFAIYGAWMFYGISAILGFIAINKGSVLAGIVVMLLALGSLVVAPIVGGLLSAAIHGG